MASAKTIDLSSKRRRFQPPITTFFTTSSDPTAPSTSSHLSHNHYSAVTHSPHPVVPAKVQASLLSVGMRVRKSIADGYKTHHAKTEEKLTTHEDKKTTLKASSTIHSTPFTRSELAPFCGISKSTEYTTSQPLPHPTNYHIHNHQTIVTDETDDAFSLPPSSQESIDSESPAPITNRTQKKRSHHDFDSGPYEDDLGEMDGVSDDELMSHAWQDPLRLHPVTHTTRRTILSPTLNHQRRRIFAAQKYNTVHSAMDLDDFEEPTFLRRREEVDMDVEVEVQTPGI
ncbi:ribonucleotide reductase inhibitor-domain-containing protein [Aspergillus aurantiobrunneus]